MSKDHIPERCEAAKEDTWDLSKLFSGDEEWNGALGEYEKRGETISSYRGTLGVSAESLAAWLNFIRDLNILGERLGYYSDLRQTEDEGDDAARTMTGRYMMAVSRAYAASSWADPEIMAIPDKEMAGFLENPILGEYKIYLKKLLRNKPYTLSDKEERIIALHSEGEHLANEAFSVLTNVDIDFGVLDAPEGKRPLSQSTWPVFMENPDRAFRQKAYQAFYRHFDAHKTTLAALYAGSVKTDVINARIRGFPSARAASLYADDVPEAVYDNLLSTVGKNLDSLHHYYNLRKRALKLDELRHYDVYVPMVSNAIKNTTWNEAASLVSKALSPLGEEYTATLRGGLLGRWADRYENKGKRSGAFSAGSYTGDPYILMNYKDDAIRDVFTLAHEGGHSMHSWYSARSNPFMQYSYSIFEAEVASTFNEELLYRYLLKEAASSNDGLKLYLVNKRADDILATLYRQTMFAEYEKITHEMEEAGKPLTVDTLRGEYRLLLEKYFGSAMTLEDLSDLEGLRIPHFYRAFYVYKYATGISAALALAERVLAGGENEKRDYFGFLKSGGSRFPIESLKVAGVDMSSPAPVEAACKAFGRIVGELDKAL
jgi:oligoendopeptidase F